MEVFQAALTRWLSTKPSISQLTYFGFIITNITIKPLSQPLLLFVDKEYTSELSALTACCSSVVYFSQTFCLTPDKRTQNVSVRKTRIQLPLTLTADHVVYVSACARKVRASLTNIIIFVVRYLNLPKLRRHISCGRCLTSLPAERVGICSLLPAEVCSEKKGAWLSVSAGWAAQGWLSGLGLAEWLIDLILLSKQTKDFRGSNLTKVVFPLFLVKMEIKWSIWLGQLSSSAI